MFPRAVDRILVARIRMAHDAGAGIIPEHTLDAPPCLITAVANDDEARVLLKGLDFPFAE